MNAMDRLCKAITACQNPTVTGLDTRLEYLPDEFARSFMKSATLENAAAAILAYNKAIIDALADIVPAVKVQLAYYEMYGVAGIDAFVKTCRYATQKGLIVMADGKRNDIGATADAYAAAYLGRTPIGDESKAAFDVDFLTVNPYLGSDGVLAFTKECAVADKGIFVLVKTSNPSSGELQDLDSAGMPLYERVALLCKQWGEGLVGECGYSAVGAVVGATYPEQGRRLRKMLPGVFFLVPGYGVQGASGADLQGVFANGSGAIVNASRSLLCAWKQKSDHPVDFAAAARDEALRMKEDLRQAWEE